MRVRSTLVLLAFVGGTARAADEPTPPAAPAADAKSVAPLNLGPAADAVLAALKAQDGGALRALASKDEPDPWLVADELLRRGEDVAASAFAQAAPRADVEKLPAYVESRRGKPDDTAARDAIDRMNRAGEKNDFNAVLESLGPAETAPPVDMMGIRRMFGRGLALQALNRPEEAAAAFLVAADAAERLGWLARAARALLLGGTCAWNRQDYRRALLMHERALGVCERRGDRPGVAQASAGWGLVHSAIGHDARACEYTERAIDLLTELGDARNLAGTVQSLGVIYVRLRDYPNALTHFERASKMLQELGDRRGVAIVISNIGTVHSGLGNYAKAIEHGERALQQLVDPGDRGVAAGILVNIGHVYSQLGSYAKALAYLERGLEEAEASAERQWAANALNMLGGIHTDLGSPEKALEYYQRALLRMDEMGDRAGVAGAVINIGNVLNHFGEHAEALKFYGRGLREAEALGERQWSANALSGRGSALLSLGEFAGAIECFEKALEVRQALGDRRGVASALLGIGRAHAELGDVPKAVQLAERAARAAEKLGSHELHVEALTLLARLRLRSGDAARALPDAHLAVSLLRNLVGGLGDEQGAVARAQHTLLFSTGLAAAAKADDAAEAAFFLESGRAGTMLESLDARDALRNAAIPEALRLARDEARSSEKRALLACTESQERGDRAASRACEQDLMAARGRVQEVAERIQREAKKEASLWYPVASPLEDIQGFLEAGDALVLCGLGARGAETCALVVTAQDARVVRLGSTKAIVEACAALDATDPDAELAPAIERLRELLLTPLALPKETTRLLVSPEGPLSYVPFAALLPGLDVAYQMSGTTYGVLLEERHKHGQKTLALGDPDYGAKFNPVAFDLYAPDTRAAGTRGKRLERLPGTREEAMAVGDVTMIGRDASEPGLRAALAKATERWHSVHFACHGLVNPDRPALSSLALTPEGEDDGFLTTLEVLEMEIPSDLVVLSACETGRGKIVGGEGIVGLTRAFMYAGAPRVICSLWKVDDEATRALMVRFYELWNPKDGKPRLPTAAALRQAQAFIRSQEKWKHPFYWAAWVLWGLPD